MMDTSRTEVWRDVVGFEGIYKISCRGRVMSIYPRASKSPKPIVMKPCLTRFGYLRITLLRSGTKRRAHVHRLVAEAFLGKPQPGFVPNHLNGKKDDNRVGNLEWVSKSENIKHAYRTNLKSATGENNGAAKLTDANIREIRKLLLSGVYQKDVARGFGVSRTLISYIGSGKIWRHV